MDWCRLWHDMPTDPKWRVIAHKAECSISDVLAVWSFMLVCASKAKQRGTLEGWVDEDVAAALDMDANAIERIRTHMNGKVLDGVLLSGWEGRQPKREDGGAERAKAWRNKQKTTGERERTQPNASERQIRVDTDKKETPLSPTETSPPNKNSEIDSVVSLWNGFAEQVGLKRVQRLTPKRRTLVAARLREAGGVAGFIATFDQIRGSPFLLGDNDRGWKADFDFVVKQSNFTKIMEGGYEPAKQKPRKTTRGEAAVAGIARALSGEAGAPGCSVEPAANGTDRPAQGAIEGSVGLVAEHDSADDHGPHSQTAGNSGDHKTEP